MHVKVRLFSTPQKVFGGKMNPFLTRLSGYFTDQTGIHAPKTKERKQSVNEVSVSFAYFTQKAAYLVPQVTLKKRPSYQGENYELRPVKLWVTTKNSTYIQRKHHLHPTNRPQSLVHKTPKHNILEDKTAIRKKLTHRTPTKKPSQSAIVSFEVEGKVKGEVKGKEKTPPPIVLLLSRKSKEEDYRRRKRRWRWWWHIQSFQPFDKSFSPRHRSLHKNKQQQKKKAAIPLARWKKKHNFEESISHSPKEIGDTVKNF